MVGAFYGWTGVYGCQGIKLDFMDLYAGPLYLIYRFPFHHLYMYFAKELFSIFHRDGSFCVVHSCPLHFPPNL